jgi:hypothetical protein
MDFETNRQWAIGNWQLTDSKLLMFEDKKSLADIVERWSG